MPAPRIGVFVCHCGRNIAGYVDIPQVVEYVRQLPNVVCAEHNLYTCSEEGILSIKKRIPEFNLNRIVVASCTPRTHEILFRSACEGAGLNKYLFEFVNIREQCSWVHMGSPTEATEKAKTLIRMGVARARLLEPLQEIKIQAVPSSLIIGGGIAGMSAALTLANQGFEVHLVEKAAQLGGILLNLHKLFTADIEAREIITPIIDNVAKHDKINVYLLARIREVVGSIGDFSVTLDWKGEEHKLKVGTIIVATGSEEFKPAGQYSYKKMEGIFTQLELEEWMKKGSVKAQNVVMVNCVGARVPERTYCSRFCCLTAIKNALLLKEDNPSSKVWILHRDLMTYGAEFEDYYRRAMEMGIRFIRYSLERPPEVVGNKKVKAVKVYHQLRQRELELPADMVVLTTPLVPNSDNEELSRMLKVPLGQEGFFLEAHLKLQPVEFATDGIYLCGSAKWPVEVAEAVSQAYAASSKAAIPMQNGFIIPDAITASVDRDICDGCAACVEVCPYNAIEIDTEKDERIASVITVLCKGCGSCGAACRSGAITMNHFSNEQVAAQIEAFT